MKLKPADIDKLIEQNAPRSTLRAEDYAEEQANERAALIQSFMAHSNTSTARVGQVLPPPPKSLRSIEATQRIEVDEGEDEGFETESGSQIERASRIRFDDDGKIINGEAKRVQERFTTEVEMPPALKGADLDKIESRSDLIRILTQNLPINEMGLPKILYRGDLLDWKLFQGNTPLGEDPTVRYETMQQYLDAATVWLNYDQGFPTVPSGEPLWARMPWEPQEHYAQFTDYCQMPGTRQVQKLVTVPLDQALMWYHEDYWALRAKCYDMMQQVHAAKKREQRMLACEDDHFLKADHLLKKLTTIANDINWDILKDDPKQFVDVMEKVIKLQRLALNLSAQGGGDSREIKAESVEIQMRRMADPNLVESRKGGAGTFDVRKLLTNPDALASAQELVIRMTKATTKTTEPVENGD